MGTQSTWALSIRLAANIVAGHLLLTLLGSQGPNAQGIVLLVLMGRLILLLCLELAVACIQAYVFTILRSLYLNELRTVSFNKNISKKKKKKKKKKVLALIPLLPMYSAH